MSHQIMKYIYILIVQIKKKKNIYIKYIFKNLLYNIHYTLYIIHYTLYIIHYTLYNI